MWLWLPYALLLCILPIFYMLAWWFVVGLVMTGLLERPPDTVYLFTSPLAGLLAGGLIGWVLSKVLRFTGRKRRMAIGISAVISLTPAVFVGIGLPGMFRSYSSQYENAALLACKNYVAAQRKFYELDPDGDGVHEYAKSLAELQQAGLIEERFARAEGLPGQAKSWHGYVFKVLTAQGPDVPGGAKSYLTTKEGDGRARLTDGFALVATPRVFDQTGRCTFVVNQSGVVYQSYFQNETLKVYEQMTEYNPGKGWVPTD